jgi:MFS family permease
MHDEGRTPPHTIKVLFTRDFILAFFAFFTFTAAFSALVPTLPLYLVRLGSKEGEIGVLVGIIGVSSLISRLLVGRILLKYSEKQVMMSGAALFALTFLALIVLPPFWPLFTVRLLQGMAFASLDTAAIAYAIKIIPLHYRARAISYFLLAPSLATALAASFGVFLANRYGFTVLLFSCVCMSLCAFFLSGRLKGLEIAKPDKAAPVHGSFFFERKIIVPAITNFLQWFIWGSLGAFFPLYAVQCGVTNPGLLFSASAIMVIAGRSLGGNILSACSKEKIMLTVLLSTMCAMIILSFSRTLPMFIFVGMLWGLGSAFFFPASMAYALEYAGSSDGTTVGTYQASLDLGLALGPVVMGIIVPLTGYRIMFLGLAVVCLINMSYFQFYVRKRVRPTRTSIEL